MSEQVQAHVYKGELHPSSGTAAVQEDTLVTVAVTSSGLSQALMPAKLYQEPHH